MHLYIYSHTTRLYFQWMYALSCPRPRIMLYCFCQQNERAHIVHDNEPRVFWPASDTELISLVGDNANEESRRGANYQRACFSTEVLIERSLHEHKRCANDKIWWVRERRGEQGHNWRARTDANQTLRKWQQWNDDNDGRDVGHMFVEF